MLFYLLRCDMIPIYKIICSTERMMPRNDYNENEKKKQRTLNEKYFSELFHKMLHSIGLVNGQLFFSMIFFCSSSTNQIVFT